MTSKNSDTRYSQKETERRFMAALRGALSTPPTPLKNITPKRPKAQRLIKETKRSGA